MSDGEQVALLCAATWAGAFLLFALLGYALGRAGRGVDKDSIPWDGKPPETLRIRP